MRSSGRIRGIWNSYYRPAYTREECGLFVDKCIGWSKAKPRSKFQLAITERSSGVFLGDCGVRTENIESRQGDIGYELSPVYWGHGYAPEAVRAMLDVGFEDLGIVSRRRNMSPFFRRSIPAHGVAFTRRTQLVRLAQAPCDPGASAANFVNLSLRRDTGRSHRRGLEPQSTRSWMRPQLFDRRSERVG